MCFLSCVISFIALPTLPSQSSPVLLKVRPYFCVNTVESELLLNIPEQHNLHFTRQLAQMTLGYLHGLMEDGARFLEREETTISGGETPQLQQLTRQDVEESLEFITVGIVELRRHLDDMPVDVVDKPEKTDEGLRAFVGVDEESHDLMEKWQTMGDKVWCVLLS